VVILGEDTPNDVSVNLNAEGLGDDSRDTGIAKSWIPAFEFDDGVDELLRWAFGSGFASAVWRVKGPVLPTHQIVMKSKQRRGPNTHGDFRNTAGPEKQRKETK